MKTVLTLSGLCLCVLALSWCCAAPRDGTGRAPVPSAAPDPALETGATLESAAIGAARAGAAPAEAAPLPPELVLGDDDLVLRLRAVQHAFVAQEMRAVESNVEFLLADPRTPRRVLAGLARGTWKSDAEAREGAILTTGFAVAHDAHSSTLAVRGRAFTADFLDALVEIPSPEAEQTAEFTAGLTDDGRPVVGVRWLTTILGLRERYADRAEVFDDLLEALLANPAEMKLAEDDLSALSIVASESRDPLAVQLALSVLLVSDPANFLPIAEEMHRAAKNDPRLSAAILRAIALHAPVDGAAASLARLADSSQYGEFARFGDRSGALHEAQNEYSRLIASDSNPKARKMLVSAMSKERPEVLIGIAETDPNASVRHQALLTVTQRPLEDDAVMRTLRSRHALRADPANGITTRQSLSVAENIAIHSQGRVRDDAIAYLREVATDPGESGEDRHAAWARLKEHATPDELAGVTAPPP
jgi:hypothetical protein